MIRSHFGSGDDLTRKSRFCCALYFTKMDLDAAVLLARTHATLVRQPSEIAGHHFEGLQAAARYKSLKLTQRHRRQLCHLDVAFNWSRHVTSVKCDMLLVDILHHASPTLAATCAATASPAPVHEYVAPAPVVTDLESVLEPLVPVVRTAPAPATMYAAPAPDVTTACAAPASQAYQEQLVAERTTQNTGVPAFAGAGESTGNSRITSFERIQEQTEEQVVDGPALPIVDDTAEKQTVEGVMEILRNRFMKRLQSKQF